jgi:hypothetical protein
MFESILCQVTEYDPDVLDSLIELAVEIVATPPKRLHSRSLNPYETLDIDGRPALGQEQRRIRQLRPARMTVRGLRIYAARSECGDGCSIETGVRLVLLCRLVNRIQVLLASLRRAHRNASMNKAAALQALVNAIGPITLTSVPRLQSHERRSSSIRTQFVQNATRHHQICTFQVRDTCVLCESRSGVIHARKGLLSNMGL